MSPRVPTLGIAVALLALTFLAYREILGYFFTGRDAISFVAEGRLERWQDLLTFFTRRQFSDTDFPGAFYRPITSLSFAADYALWRLNPLGYHLTDLLIHWGVGMMVYLLGRRAMGLGRGAAAIAAALFILHPTHQGTVPVIARRIDPIATLFTFAAVLLFAQSIEAENQRKMRWASWVTYLLALLSKETAVVALPAMALLAWKQGRGKAGRCRECYVARALAPFLLLTTAYVITRTCVLGGIGGYADRSVLRPGLVQTGVLAARYVRLLFNPISFWRGSGLPVYVIGLSILSLSGIVAYRIRRDLGLDPFPYLLALTWIASQLLLLLLAQTLTTQHLYAPLAWWCLLLARLAQDGWALARRGPATQGARTGTRGPVGWLSFAFVLVIAAVLVLASSLRGMPRGWRDVSESERRFLSMLDERLQGIPDGTRVDLMNLPFLQPADQREREVAYLTWLVGYGISDWVALRAPERHWDLHAQFNTAACAPLEYEWLESQPARNAVRFDIRYADMSLSPPCPPE